MLATVLIYSVKEEGLSSCGSGLNAPFCVFLDLKLG